MQDKKRLQKMLNNVFSMRIRICNRMIICTFATSIQIKKMKKTMYSLFSAVLLGLMLISAKSDEPVITKQGGQTVINTTSIGADVKGFKGPTPVKIYLKSDKVVKVEMLATKDGPKFVEMVKNGILSKWNGKTVDQAISMNVDAVTGATFTSNGVKENVKRGLQYYKDSKKKKK